MLTHIPPSKKRMGYVYLVKSGDYHKIGLTRRDPRTRIREITTPEGTSVVHVIETYDPEGCEKFLHEEFKYKRAEREWFRLDKEDVEWVKQIKTW